MLRLILARIPQMLVVVIGVTFIAFCLVNVLPGNIIIVILGSTYTTHEAAVLTKELGLNHPLVIRYFDWLFDAVQGNFGKSLLTHESVAQMMWQAALPTLELVIGGQVVGLVLAVGLGIASVSTRQQWVDKTGTGLALFATSMPGFVLALLLIALLGVHWHLISTIGWRPPSSDGWWANLSAIALPCFLLGLGIFPGSMRLFRAELREQLEADGYVTLARMTGASNRRVIVRHVVRNSVFGLLTLAAVTTGFLLGGAVIIENIFAIPGFGSMILEAVTNRDSPVVVGAIAVVAVVVVLMNLVADLAYAALDPRIRDAAG